MRTDYSSMGFFCCLPRYSICDNFTKFSTSISPPPHPGEYLFITGALILLLVKNNTIDIFPHTSIILLDFLLIYKGLKKNLITNLRSLIPVVNLFLLYFLAVCLLVLHFKVGFGGGRGERRWAGFYFPVDSFSFPVSNLCLAHQSDLNISQNGKEKGKLQVKSMS